jgi:hypothetical protein
MADVFHARGFTTEDSLPADDNLFAGDKQSFGEKATLVSGQNLTRGALLGQITASGKYNLALSAAGDGSNTPRAILAHDCDASGGDKECIVYKEGTFNTNAITLGTGITLSTATKEALRALGIFFRTNLPA